ncbi:immunity protein YezG family protein, partial [Macrococcus capreoli]
MLEKLINEKIIEIVEQANEMIPEEWCELYINGSVNDGEGTIYFFYNTEENINKWQYSATMQFEIAGYSQEYYSKAWDVLFDLADELQQI